MNNYFIISAIILVLASCDNDHQLTSSQKSVISEEVRQTLLQYYEDVKRSGLHAEFKYLDSTEDFFWIPPSYDRWLGYDTVSSIIKRNAAAFDSVINSIDTIQVFPLTPSLATYTARINSRMVDTAGQTAEFRLIENAVIIRRRGGWRLLQGQTTVIAQ